MKRQYSTATTWPSCKSRSDLVSILRTYRALNPRFVRFCEHYKSVSDDGEPVGVHWFLVFDRYTRVEIPQC